MNNYVQKSEKITFQLQRSSCAAAKRITSDDDSGAYLHVSVAATVADDPSGRVTVLVGK